jgi:hypothetical protein
MERRYLIVPGINSSRIHILDTKPDPRQPTIVKVIEPDELANRAGYASPHTIHCGPDGIYVSALGAPGGDGPGGTFVMDPETFDIRGQWEIDRGPQHLAYDASHGSGPKAYTRSTSMARRCGRWTLGAWTWAPTTSRRSNGARPARPSSGTGC